MFLVLASWSDPFFKFDVPQNNASERKKEIYAETWAFAIAGFL
jgi:hypothetical protein